LWDRFPASGGILAEGSVKLGLIGGLTGLGLFALTGYSQAAVLTIDLNNYASAVDSTSGQLLGTMVATDATGGVDVTVSLTNPATEFFASTGGGHVTIAWNLDTPTAATNITPTSVTFTAVTNDSPPGCVSACGSFTNGLQGNWSGTSNSFAGPVSFFLAGITTTDFVKNSDGFMGAIDALGPAGTGEIAGMGSGTTFSSGVPEPSTWAMMMLGFAGLAYAGYRRTKSPRTILAAD
jgi:hypothetical protein